MRPQYQGEDCAETADQHSKGGRVAAPKSSNAHHKMKGGVMPSPPDVILVLSPRTARLVQFAVQNLAVSPEFVDFDEEQEFADTGEAEDAANALVAEIGEQLSRDHDATVEYVVAPSEPHAGRPTSDVERLAAKMAKAARKAVEG
jgi:hypothetical protein